MTVRLALGCALLLLAAPARAQTTAEREAEIARSLYDAGKYEDAATRATAALEGSNLGEPLRIELLKIAGLSAFNLQDVKTARARFLALLELNPDYVLDPFSVPPPALRLFDGLRQDNAAHLDLVRQKLALKAEQERAAAEERERQQAEAEARRRRLEALSSTVTVRTVERRSMLLNFVPFGAGQFQQGRTGWGVAFAVSEGVLGALSVVSYFVIDSMREPITYTWDDRLTADGTGRFSVTVMGIPSAKQDTARAWGVVQLSSGIGFYALWAVGIGDALWHHQGEVVTERTEPAHLDDAAATPTARLHLFPTPGGLGAGLRVGF